MSSDTADHDHGAHDEESAAASATPSADGAAAEKEGDALLDMLFEDAAEMGNPVGVPHTPPVATGNPGAAREGPPPLPRAAPAVAAAPPPPPFPMPTPAASPSIVEVDEIDTRATVPADSEVSEAPTVVSTNLAQSGLRPGDLADDPTTVDIEAAEVTIDADEAPPEEAPARVSAVPPSVAPVPQAAPVSSPTSVPLPSRRPPPVAFEHEEDASALLLRQQQRDGWVARAEWLRAEAATQPEPARARGLLVVSELLAMAGEDEAARAAADEALRLAPQSPMAHRQARGLVSREGNWTTIVEALDAETRAAPTAEAKCHGALLGAEIARLGLSDDEGAKRRVEQAHRAMPSDPRAHIQRFCEMLAAAEPDGASEAARHAHATKVRIPELDELGPLPAAAAQVVAHRGAPPASKGKADKPPATSYEALLRVRSSANGTDAAPIVAGLEALARAPSLARGAFWLAGVLAAVNKSTRSRAVHAFGEVASGSHAALASRALAARAIELGDAEAARSATQSASSEAFTAADRVALAALAGDGSASALAPWLSTLASDPELAPLAAAANAVMGGDAPAENDSRHDNRSKASTTLGRALASGSSATLATAVHAFAETAPDSSLARTLELELAVEQGAGGRVARAVSEWREDSDLERERGMAGALIAEAAGETDRAKEELLRLRAVDPTNEAIARAAASHAGGEGGAKILGDLALALERSPRAAVLLVEAAARLATAGDANESDALLRRALEAEPELPLAHHLGERAARARGDREALIEWVRARRDASGDPLEQAHDLVREALLLSEENPAAAAPLLEAALRARPSDTALREVYERLAPEPPADRASWRADRAAEATGSEAARLWLEAAFEMERAGDLAGFAKSAQLAAQAGENALAPIATYRAAVAGHGAGELIDQLLPKARESTDSVERLEIYERLADLDERGRGDAGSGLLWRRTILEETGGHLPTLRRVASTLVTAGRDAELEPVALDIARALEGPESVAHAMLAARLHQLGGTWDETREAVEIAYKYQPRGVWALRQMAAHARAAGDPQVALEAERALIDRTTRPSEAATLSLRAAQSALKAGMVDDALAFLGQAKTLVPEHIVVHEQLADLLEQTNNHAGAAASLEDAAKACVTPAERSRILYRAAKLWHDQAGNAEAARTALEAVAEIDPSYEDVFERLQGIYVAAGARAELAALLERRLEAVTDPTERVEMEVLRGRALADVGDAAAAKRALAAALEANPDHVEALGAFAEVCAVEADWASAEQAWIRLARLVPDPEKQAAIYYRLGEVYDDHLPNPERAELAYQEILKHAPNDPRPREKLVALYRKLGDAPRAIEQQTLLVNGAEAPEAKCQRTAQLAEIYESVGDIKKAEATLLQARKTWPKDDVALASLARFYVRTNQAQAANVLLDRAVADARRALGTGRFEPYLFSTIAAVAELRNRPDAARVAHAAVAALEGGDAALEGGGAAAAEPKLDELLAPDVLTLPFRDLLKRTGPLLDASVPFDLASVRAAALAPQLADIGEMIRDTAASYGFPQLQVYTSTVLGSVCVPVSTHPPVIVLGQPLVTSSREDVKSFLVHRALKVLQANAASLARTAPIDLWPLIAAYLRAFSPSWQPQGVDQGKLTDYYARITRAMTKNVDPQTALLAAEVIGSIGNRASTLNTVINGWGNRAGLLACGDLNVAIAGIAWSGGHTNAPPANGKDRMTWIGRNAEARELVVFSVSDGYADARSELGLAMGETELIADDIEVEE